jgi:transposase-like protein
MTAVKAIHASEDRAAARDKAAAVASKLEGMRLAKAARIIRDGVEETLAYYSFPREHWRSLRTNNPLERLNKEIRRRTRVVGAFPDGQSALMLVCARLRHMAGTHWGLRRYLNMKLLWSLEAEQELATEPAAAVQSDSRLPARSASYCIQIEADFRLRLQ